MVALPTPRILSGRTRKITNNMSVVMWATAWRVTWCLKTTSYCEWLCSTRILLILYNNTNYDITACAIQIYPFFLSIFFMGMLGNFNHWWGNPMPMADQVSGLRGAIAFALSLRVPCEGAWWGVFRRIPGLTLMCFNLYIYPGWNFHYKSSGLGSMVLIYIYIIIYGWNMVRLDLFDYLKIC
jgi:hypothetical protein